MVEEIERERRIRLATIRQNPLALSPAHRPGTISIQGIYDDNQRITCPGCGTIIVSSLFDYMWRGIDCDICGCRFATLDDDAYLWNFEQMPTKDVNLN